MSEHVAMIGDRLYSIEHYNEIVAALTAAGWTPPPEPKQQAEFATGKILEALNAPFRGDADLTRRLRAAGWLSEPPKPKVHRVRVYVDANGDACAHKGERSQRIDGDLASAIVELTEGVFDEEWKP